LAANILGSMGHPIAKPALELALKDVDPVRKYAEKALVTLAAQKQKVEEFVSAEDAENIDRKVDAIRKAAVESAGLEELTALEETAPDVLSGQSAKDFIEQRGGMVPGAAQQMAGQRYISRPEVQQALQANDGRLQLAAEIAGKLTGRSDALGGLLISGSAADLSAEDLMVIADSDLSNPAAQRVLAWIPGGSDSQRVAKTLGILKAGPRQVALFEEEPGLTYERVQALIAKNLSGAPSPRSVVGTQEQVRALPVAAFKILGRMKGLPDVVFLGVALTFKDQYDQQYSLIVWTQA